MMRTYFCTFVYIVLVRQSFARTSNSALLVLGGGFQIYVDSHDQSPVLQSFDIFGCSASSLPDYPIEVFFIFGGLDPSSSKPVLETETFDDEVGIWTIHKSLPVIENHVFQN